MLNQDNRLVESFLNRTFFSGWQNSHQPQFANYVSLELQINSRCDLACRYCYYSKFGHHLYPESISEDSLVLRNLDLLLEWLSKNCMNPEIEIFSGEPFSQEIGFTVLEKLIDWGIKNRLCFPITVPTNFTFIFDQSKTERLNSLIKKGLDNQISVRLSASIDGKFYDNINRPMVNGRQRDEEYYNEVFKFCKQWNFSFHPMIYSHLIERWKENFLWFQSKFEEFGFHFSTLYLLEVRNKNWTVKQIREFYKVIRFIVNWVYDKSGLHGEEFVRFVFSGKLLNLFSILSTNHRGVGCSVQSNVQLRLGDLMVSVCHRTAYKPFNLWKFTANEHEITGVEAINPNLMLTVASLDTRNMPICECCLVRELCIGQCLGSMFETNGDPFMPIPTVCALEHAKIAAILDGIWDIGEMGHFYNISMRKKKDSIRLIEIMRGHYGNY